MLGFSKSDSYKMGYQITAIYKIALHKKGCLIQALQSKTIKSHYSEFHTSAPFYMFPSLLSMNL